MLQVLSDITLDEKTVADEEAAQWRIDEFWKLKEFNSSLLKKARDVRNTVAYGHKGLGMPLFGVQSNFQNLGFSHLNAFRKEHATPDRMVVYGGGILNHSEFVNAVSPYFKQLKADKGPAREKTQYLGGEFREHCESPLTTVALHFEGAKASNQLPQLVAQTLIGSTGDRALSRAQTHFHSNYPWLHSVQADTSAYSDSGLFGLVVQFPGNKGAEAADLISQQLTSLAAVDAAEVERAKKALIMSLLESHEDTTLRLRQIMKSAAVSGKVYSLEEAVSAIQQVTADQVKQFIAKALKSPPTLVVLGGDNHAVPSADKFAQRFK
jgi:predicted Zn-dependent peptidase